MLHNMGDMEWFFQHPNPKSRWYISRNTFTKLAVVSFSTADVIDKLHNNYMIINCTVTLKTTYSLM